MRVKKRYAQNAHFTKTYQRHIIARYVSFDLRKNSAYLRKSTHCHATFNRGILIK
jgi:hypothetical protein